MLLPRILTALLLGPLVLVVIWAGSVPFFLFVLGVCIVSQWEFSRMAEDGGYPGQPWWAIFGTALVVTALWVDGLPGGTVSSSPGPLFVLVVWLFGSFVREFPRRDKGHSLLRVMTGLSGVIVCGLLMGHMLLVRDLTSAVPGVGGPVGRGLMFFLLVVIWSVDTGAWMVGRAAGRHHLAPQLSPKKTWEGAAGGTLFAVIAGCLMQATMLRGVFTVGEAALYAAGVAIAAQFSDLIESMIKRSFGAKDSSQILPGHGGIFDRFDSFIFAAPFFYHALVMSGRFR